MTMEGGFVNYCGLAEVKINGNEKALVRAGDSNHLSQALLKGDNAMEAF